MIVNGTVGLGTSTPMSSLHVLSVVDSSGSFRGI